MSHDCQTGVDENGRVRRWVRDKPNITSDEPRKCCHNDSNHSLYDLAFVENLEIFEMQLYDNIRMRKRAISNWKKVKVLLVMLKLSGGRFDPTLVEQVGEVNVEKGENADGDEKKVN